MGFLLVTFAVTWEIFFQHVQLFGSCSDLVIYGLYGLPLNALFASGGILIVLKQHLYCIYLHNVMSDWHAKVSL